MTYSLKNRPRIAIVPGPADRILEILGWLALSALWVLAISVYSYLPDTIPVHFNASGEPDNYGGKNSIFIMPVIGTVIFIALTWLNRYPHIFNYPVSITEDNAAAQYRMGTRLIRYLKLAIAVVFIFIVWMSYRSAYDNAAVTGNWILPVLLLIIFIPLILYFLRASRLGSR